MKGFWEGGGGVGGGMGAVQGEGGGMFCWLSHYCCLCLTDRLVGQVVKASASKAADPGFDSRFHDGDFSGSSHSSDFKISNPVATLKRHLALARYQYKVTG